MGPFPEPIIRSELVLCDARAHTVKNINATKIFENKKIP